MRFEIHAEHAIDAPSERTWRWRLISDDGAIVARGGAIYVDEDECRQSMALVQCADGATPIAVVSWP